MAVCVISNHCDTCAPVIYVFETQECIFCHSYSYREEFDGGFLKMLLHLSFSTMKKRYHVLDLQQSVSQ